MANEQNNLHLNKLTISKGETSIDITEVFDELVFFEDLFSFTMSGTVKLSESINIPEVLPIIGDGETITASFTTYERGSAPEKKFEHTFEIYKITNWQNKTTTNLISYVIHFVSSEFIKNIASRLTCSYGTEQQGMKSNEIVRSICENILGISSNRLNIEETKFEWKPLVCANWKPFQAINYLAQEDINTGSTEDQNSTFVFFEDKFGFNFVSWASLLEDKFRPDKEISRITYTPRLENKSFLKEYSDPTQVIEFLVDEHFDTFQILENGMLSSRYIYHDVIKKKINTVDFDYNTEFDNMSTVESKAVRNKLISQREVTNSNTVMLLPGEYHYENHTLVGSPWPQMARSRVKQLDNNILFVEVVGNTGHNLGNVLLFDIPSPLKDEAGNTKNYAHLSGKFLVTKIKHSITKKSGYRQTLELRKGVIKKV